MFIIRPFSSHLVKDKVCLYVHYSERLIVMCTTAFFGWWLLRGRWTKTKKQLLLSPSKTDNLSFHQLYHSQQLSNFIFFPMMCHYCFQLAITCLLNSVAWMKIYVHMRGYLQRLIISKVNYKNIHVHCTLYLLAYIFLKISVVFSKTTQVWVFCITNVQNLFSFLICFFEDSPSN